MDLSDVTSMSDVISVHDDISVQVAIDCNK